MKKPQEGTPQGSAKSERDRIEKAANLAHDLFQEMSHLSSHEKRRSFLMKRLSQLEGEEGGEALFARLKEEGLLGIRKGGSTSAGGEILVQRETRWIQALGQEYTHEQYLSKSPYVKVSNREEEEKK